MIRAIGTAVHTVVGKVERGKKHYTIPVKGQLNLFRKFDHFFIQIRNFTGQKDRGFFMVQSSAM